MVRDVKGDREEKVLRISGTHIYTIRLWALQSSEKKALSVVAGGGNERAGRRGLE